MSAALPASASADAPASTPAASTPAPAPAPLPAPAGWPSFPYLRGNYGPVFEEHARDVASIEGDVPRQLRGAVYCRNGPNPHFAPVAKHHWFDGDGMLHAIRFEDDGSVI